MKLGTSAFKTSLSSTLWSTVSKAAERSRATKMVQSHGFCLLRSCWILLVMMFRAVVVECSALKPCWCSAWRKLMKSFSSSLSITLAIRKAERSVENFWNLRQVYLAFAAE